MEQLFKFTYEKMSLLVEYLRVYLCSTEEGSLTLGYWTWFLHWFGLGSCRTYLFQLWEGSNVITFYVLKKDGFAKGRAVGRKGTFCCIIGFLIFKN